MQIEAFEKGRVNSRRYRNRRIGEFFKDLGMTEGRSTGIKKIIDSMAENTSSKPIFDFDEEHTYFQVTLPVHEEVLKKVSIIEENTTPQVTPQVLNLLENLEDEMTRDEIMQQLNLKDRKNFRENYLNPAIDNKLIELTIPDKPQSSKQKYRVTSNGKEVLKQSLCHI